jgi:hypothetical protein
MKKIEWWIVQANGKPHYRMFTRDGARREKKWLDQNIFEEFNHELVYPLKIVRKEWALVNEKVVR